LAALAERDAGGGPVPPAPTPPPAPVPEPEDDEPDAKAFDVALTKALEGWSHAA
jgi:hypothetical protein